MNFEEFTNTIIEHVSNRLDDVTVKCQPVRKNNGVELHGLLFLDKGNISPTIYIDTFYSQYETGRPLADIMDDIIIMYQDNKSNEVVDISFFTDFEKVKTKIICSLVNYELNEELLKDIPHYRFLDLVIIFKVYIDSFVDGIATILIRNKHLDIWNVSKETLKNLAIPNTPRILPYELSNMGTILNELLESEGEDFNELNLEIPMYVLSNKVHMYGAVSLLYEDILKELSNKLNSDLYILPSSIHELILIPVSSRMDEEEFSQMVKEVNATQLSKDEILSDHVYYYNRATNLIM